MIQQRWKGIMKCYPFEEKRLLKWDPPFIVQPKYDGVRCRAVPSETLNDSGVRPYHLLSSEENIIFSVPHILSEIQSLGISTELDGELYCHGMSFEQIYSITSRTTNLHPDARSIKFHIFDIIEDDPQAERLLKLRSISQLFRDHLIFAPFRLCGSLDDIQRAYEYFVSQGYEGIVVRHHLAPYERKRSTWVMKFKPKKEDIYKILGYEEEISKEGIPKGRLGALVCASGNGQTFRVGSGFTDEDRERFWEIRGILNGMSCRVKYQHTTYGRAVPRFPVFVDIVT